MTLIELFKEYFANRSDLTRKCANSMRQRMEKYILPLLGARDIDGIRISEIYRLLQGLYWFSNTTCIAIPIQDVR